MLLIDQFYMRKILLATYILLLLIALLGIVEKLRWHSTGVFDFYGLCIFS